MFIRLILPCAIAVSASFASLNTAQAQPCSSNFTSAGVPMLSEISYRSWDLVKNPPAKAISAAARVVSAEGFGAIRIDKATNTLTALQDGAGSGRLQSLKITARKSGGATRLDLIFTVQAGQIGHEGEVRRGFCNVIEAARR
jgi:hypothetical protein